MFSHISLAADDFEGLRAFYSAVLTELGFKERFYKPEAPYSTWCDASGERPLLFLTTPFNGEGHHAGNGQMNAYLAPSREAVTNAYEAAIANGATDEGAPGLRPQYHPNYFGAYARDPFGNKFCICCHEAE